MKQNFPILPAIFGQKLLKLGCYTMENFVIPKTELLHRGDYFTLKEKCLYLLKRTITYNYNHNFFMHK